MMQLCKVLSLAIGLVLLPVVALAGPLDDAKASGLVGERIDGYLGIVPANAPREVEALVDRVNEKRRAKYAEVAEQRDVAVEAVAAIAGRKLVGRAEAGEYVAGADGRWQQR